MTISEVMILALVQGLTEFLPVSSSGHLVIARMIFHISDSYGTAVDSFLHLGTLVAIILYYWRVWWGLIRSVFIQDEQGTDKRQLLVKLVVATLPAALVGYVAKDMVEMWFRGPLAIVGGLLFTAVILVVTDFMSTRQTTLARIDFRGAWLVGLAQVIALVPSISRSGATIAAGRALGLSRKQATTFSFLMSAPIIAGAGLFSSSSLILDHAFSWSFLLVGFSVSLVSGLLAIWLLMKVIERISFMPFAIYLVVIAGILWLWA